MKIDFYQGFDPEAAADIERLSRLIYELRQNRARILQPYEVSHESELVRRIADGKLDEHPAYEHYLSARIWPTPANRCAWCWPAPAAEKAA